ncbi:MAG: TrkH family potassium uptake protein [Planctomycetes bacterium]|nr:TrkH family potassium uptake protein [Planctomycetota bacterium]
MNGLLPVLLVLARLAGLAGLLLLAPLALEVAGGAASGRGVLGFALPAALCFALYAAARLGVRGEQPELSTPQQGFLCVGLGWLLFAAIGALPFWISGALDGLVDAFFESMSGFTTTGATVFASVERLPRAILLWRALTHFIGGLGIIALFVAVLPALGAGGVVLLRSEVAPALLEERLRPRIQDTAKVLWYVYAGLCLAECGALLCCGVPFFDALCHSMATISTGGFSTRDQSLGAFSPAAQWVVIAFMFIGGASFLLHAKAVQGDGRAYLRSDEFRLYAGILLVATALTTIATMATHEPGAAATAGVSPLDPASHDYGSFLTALRHAAFQVTSIMTTTGFVTADYERWPDFVRLLLVALMFIGGCSASTAGGVKVFRYLLILRSARRQVATLLSPNRIVAVRLGGSNVPAETLLAAAMTFALFVLITGVSALVLLLLGVPLIEAASGTAACICCVGPALGVLGPAGNYADLPAVGKLLLSLVMLMGRLEIYAILVLMRLKR